MSVYWWHTSNHPSTCYSIISREAENSWLFPDCGDHFYKNCFATCPWRHAPLCDIVHGSDGFHCTSSYMSLQSTQHQGSLQDISNGWWGQSTWVHETFVCHLSWCSDQKTKQNTEHAHIKIQSLTMCSTLWECQQNWAEFNIPDVLPTLFQCIHWPSCLPISMFEYVAVVDVVVIGTLGELVRFMWTRFYRQKRTVCKATQDYPPPPTHIQNLISHNMESAGIWHRRQRKLQNTIPATVPTLLIHALTHSRTPSLTNTLTHSLPDTLIHSLTQSPPH